MKVSFTSKNQDRLKNLKALSGGQKAAVGLTLILAIQVVRMYAYFPRSRRKATAADYLFRKLQTSASSFVD